MSDRPTPETDELDLELHTPYVLQDRYSEMREHAQKLERERDEAREEAKNLRRMSVFELMGENLNVKHHVTEWENRCMKAERERDDYKWQLHIAKGEIAEARQMERTWKKEETK